MGSSKPTTPPVAPTDPPDWRRLRLWHIQPVRDVLVLAMVFGVLYLGYVLRPITVPMLLAVMLAYLFEPLVQRMTRTRRIGRPMAAFVIIAGFFFVVIVPIGLGLGVGIGQATGFVENVAQNTQSVIDAVQEKDPARRDMRIQMLPRGWRSLGKELNEFRAYVPKLREQEQGAKPEGQKEPGATPPPPATPDQPAGESPAPRQPDTAAVHIPEWRQHLYSAAYSGIEWMRANADNLAKSIGQQAIVTGQGAIATVVGILGTLAFLGFSAFLTAFFFFFFSTGWGKVLDFWAGLIPERKKGRAFDLITKMDRVIAGFVRGRLTICAIMMVVFTLGYWFIGVPSPFLVGPLVGMLFLVPFLHVLSIPLGIILLWLQPSSIAWQNNWWWIVFAPIGVDLMGQFLDDWVLSPVIQGKNTEMDMPTILFASMAGGALAGMYGLLVAIPVAACIRILVKELFWPKFRRWARGEERDFLPISSSDDPAHHAKR